MKAAASSRAYEHATLACGLITVPISVFSGTVADAGVSRKMFTKDDHPVGFASVDKVTGELIDRTEVVKKIETEHGFVFVEDHEIEQLFELTPKTITIKSFQPEALFGTAYVPKTLFCVEADKIQVGKKKMENKPGQQALALVLAAMKAEQAIALVEFTSRGVPKPAVLLSDGTLWVVYHDEELREHRALPVIDLAPELVAQGQGLIRALWNDEPEDLTDTRTALIQGFADAKAEAGDFEQPEAPVLSLVPTAAPTDLLALLTRSVAAAKVA